MRDSNYKQLITKELSPTLIALGFKEINLEHCMHPEILFNKGRLWFGTSWDWRDLHLEIDLGHLYWFDDVMPRVIILGEYSNYIEKINDIKPTSLENLRPAVELLRETLGEAIDIYNQSYDHILSKYLQPKKTKYAKVFALHLGDEVVKHELTPYRI